MNKEIKKIQRQLMRNLVSPRVLAKEAAARSLKISEKKCLTMNQVKYVSNYILKNLKATCSTIQEVKVSVCNLF